MATRNAASWILVGMLWTGEASGGARSETSGEPDRSERNLLFPVPAVSPSAMSDTFKNRRGKRLHHAVDILAPRHSDVVAVADGTIARLMTNGAGGIAVYQLSEDRRSCYFYAHLQGYAHGLREGQQVARGQIIGFVGTTGNAPADRPHLHFAIARDLKKDQWWGGKPVNPYPLWR